MDEATPIAIENHGSLRLSAFGGQPRLQFGDVQHGRLRLQSAHFGLNHDVEVDALGDHVIIAMTDGAADHGRRAYLASYRPDDVFLVGQPTLPDACSVYGQEALVAMITPEDLTGVGGLSATNEPIRFSSHQPVSVAAGRLWTDAVHFVWNSVLGSPVAAESALVVSGAERFLIASALTTFPNDSVTEATKRDRHDASPPALRRAIAFIDENVDQPISMSAIAAAGGVTVRAVQLAFRRHLDVTPMQYLRAARLARAHADLDASDPTRDTVTGIAYRWGFGSPSQFAARYHDRYGQQPSATLRDG